MIDFNPNSQATIFVTLTRDNKPLIGATVTVTVVNPAGTTIVTAAAATEEGEGVYSYGLSAANTATIGTYYVTWNVSTPIVLQQKTTFAVGWETAFAQTQLDIRHMASKFLEGKESFYKGTVDSAALGTLVDADRVEPSNSLVGWYAYIYAGNGAGQERRITANSPTTTTLTLAKNWTTLPIAGSLYEVHRYFPVADYNDAIRQAVMDVSNLVLVPVTDSTITLATSTYEYDIPVGFSHLFQVQINTRDDLYKTIAPSCWGVKRGLRKLWIFPEVVHAYTGQKLLLLGLRPPTEPLDDTSGIDVRPSYVIKKACAYLSFSKMNPGGNDTPWTTKHQFFEAEAAVEKNELNKLIPSNTRRVE